MIAVALVLPLAGSGGVPPPQVEASYVSVGGPRHARAATGRVAPNQRGHDARVGHAQARDAVDAQLR